MSEIVQEVQGCEGVCEQIEYVSSSHLTANFSDSTKYQYRILISADTIAQVLKKYKYLVISADYPYSSGGSSGNMIMLEKMFPVEIVSKPYFGINDRDHYGNVLSFMASSGSFLLDILNGDHTQVGIVGRLYGIY